MTGIGRVYDSGKFVSAVTYDLRLDLKTNGFVGELKLTGVGSTIEETGSFTLRLANDRVLKFSVVGSNFDIYQISGEGGLL